MPTKQKTFPLFALIAILVGFGASSQDAPQTQPPQVQPQVQTQKPSQSPATYSQSPQQQPVVVNVYPPPCGDDAQKP
jgi:hypothetical protein